jgi:hypothetical protein
MSAGEEPPSECVEVGSPKIVPPTASRRRNFNRPPLTWSQLSFGDPGGGADTSWAASLKDRPLRIDGQTLPWGTQLGRGSRRSG